ncbi:hypothetical protein ID866_11402 [Astraeus odoratus]|nr:hypothetical protein ID866_11402 [Astraeus odoratus]
MEHSLDIAQVQEHVWKAYHSLSMALDLPFDPMKEMMWMTRAVKNLAAAKYPAIYIPQLLIAASKVFSAGNIHLDLKDLIWPDTPGLEQDQWDNKWWLALAPQQEDNAPVEGKGKWKATKQPMEALKIKVPPIKKQKQSGEDEDSEDGEEEAEGSRSISMLIFELCTPATQPMLTTPPMDPATPAEMEEEGDEDLITMMPTPSPPCKKAHHIQVRTPSPLTLAPGPVPSTSMSTSHLTPAGGSTSTTASAAPPTLVQPHQSGAYVLVDTFQQVLVWEHMTQLEHKMAKMTTNMCHWQDNIITDYLKLNQHIRTMEDNQHEFIRQ